MCRADRKTSWNLWSFHFTKSLSLSSNTSGISFFLIFYFFETLLVFPSLDKGGGLCQVGNQHKTFSQSFMHESWKVAFDDRGKWQNKICVAELSSWDKDLWVELVILFLSFVSRRFISSWCHSAFHSISFTIL